MSTDFYTKPENSPTASTYRSYFSFSSSGTSNTENHSRFWWNICQCIFNVINWTSRLSPQSNELRFITCLDDFWKKSPTFAGMTNTFNHKITMNVALVPLLTAAIANRKPVTYQPTQTYSTPTETSVDSYTSTHLFLQLVKIYDVKFGFGIIETRNILLSTTWCQYF